MFYLQFLTDELVDAINRWSDLKRWQRREIGQTLRRMGLSYREISAVIPVHKGTLSGWCAEIDLSTAQEERLGAKRPRLESRRQHGVHRRMAARKARCQAGSTAAVEAAGLRGDAAWAAGTVAYWSEGAKTGGVRFSNSDPDLVRLFVDWARKYLGVIGDRFVVSLHLHSGQDELERKTYWSFVTGVPLTQFGATYVKPEGTGHRKNVSVRGHGDDQATAQRGRPSAHPRLDRCATSGSNVVTADAPSTCLRALR